MAKRPIRSQAEDTGTATPTPRQRRPRGATAQRGEGAAPVASDTQAARATIDQEAPADLEPTDRPGALTSESMGSEPTEEDIRMRAYQRYLERGGSHGGDFDDWLEAERELRTPKTSR